MLEAENQWISQYRHCIYIQSPGLENAGYEQHTRECARLFGWQYESLRGDNRLLSSLLAGQWEDTEFLICPPGYYIEAAYDEAKIRAAAPRQTGQGGIAVKKGEGI